MKSEFHTNFKSVFCIFIDLCFVCAFGKRQTYSEFFFSTKIANKARKSSKLSDKTKNTKYLTSYWCKQSKRLILCWYEIIRLIKYKMLGLLVYHNHLYKLYSFLDSFLILFWLDFLIIIIIKILKQNRVTPLRF